MRITLLPPLHNHPYKVLEMHKKSIFLVCLSSFPPSTSKSPGQTAGKKEIFSLRIKTNTPPNSHYTCFFPNVVH